MVEGKGYRPVLEWSSLSLLLVLLFLFLLLVVVPVAQADSLDATVVGMFPKNVTEIAYTDLEQARELPWFPQFAAQVVPVSLYEFDQFLSAAQAQTKSSIDQVVWARFSVPGGASDPAGGRSLLAAIAKGQFDTDAIKLFLKVQKIPAIEIEGASAYAAQTGGDVFFTLLDTNTIAFGSLDALRRVLRVRAGNEASLFENENMMSGIGRVNGEGIFWGVLGSQNAQTAVEGLLPMAAAFSQSGDLARKITEVAISASDLRNIEVDFHVKTASAKDSWLFSQLLQAGLLYRQYQAHTSNPDLAQILSGIGVAFNGNEMDISVNLSDEQMLGLIEHDTFRVSF